MSLPRPDHIWRQVEEALKTETVPMEPFQRRAYLVMRGEEQDPDIFDACEIYSNIDDRETLLAYYFSGATEEEMSMSLHIRLPVVQMFTKLFMDMSVFKHKLHVLRYIKGVIQTFTDNSRALVEMGVLNGPDYLIYHHRHGREFVPINKESLQQSMVQEAYYLGTVARGNSIASAQSRESLRWLSLASKMLGGIGEKFEGDEETSEPILAIKKLRSSTTTEELNLSPDKLLH